jgi:hypothetical protein
MEARRPAIWWLLLAAVAACGGHNDATDTVLLAEAASCVDLDQDGFGMGCVAGADCDDSDPAVWDTCPVKPVCDDGDQRDCQINLPKHGNVNSCLHGVERCEGGEWSRCEAEETTHGSR